MKIIRSLYFIHKRECAFDYFVVLIISTVCWIVFRLKPDQLEFLLEVEQLRILFWEECELSNSQREQHYNQCTVSVRTEKKHSWFLKSFIFYQFCWQDKLSQATLIFSFTKHCLSGIILSECGSDVMGMPNSWCWLGHLCWQPINWPIYVVSVC